MHRTLAFKLQKYIPYLSEIWTKIFRSIQEKLVKFILACQDDETGGFADRPGDMVCENLSTSCTDTSIQSMMIHVLFALHFRLIHFTHYLE